SWPRASRRTRWPRADTADAVTSRRRCMAQTRDSPAREPAMARLLLPAAVLVALACGACGQGPEDSTPAATAPPDPAAIASIEHDAPPAAAPDGALRYACGDGGIVTIAWSGDDARVELGDGRTVTLPKAQSASSG